MATLEIFNQISPDDGQVMENSIPVIIRDLPFVQVTYGSEAKFADEVLHYDSEGYLHINGNQYADITVY